MVAGLLSGFFILTRFENMNQNLSFEAGTKGNFRLTLGIARENNRKELEENGADWVVEDLKEIGALKG